jgi:hypothetical protein
MKILSQNKKVIVKESEQFRLESNYYNGFSDHYKFCIVNKDDFHLCGYETEENAKKVMEHMFLSIENGVEFYRMPQEEDIQFLDFSSINETKKEYITKTKFITLNGTSSKADEDKVNNFIKNKNIIDIQYIIDEECCIVIYKEEIENIINKDMVKQNIIATQIPNVTRKIYDIKGDI